MTTVTASLHLRPPERAAPGEAPLSPRSLRTPM